MSKYPRPKSRRTVEPARVVTRQPGPITREAVPGYSTVPLSKPAQR